MKRILFGATVLSLAAGLVTAAGPGRKYIVLRPPATSNAPFSEGVLSGNTLYVSGHIGLDPQTRKPGATPAEEGSTGDGISETHRRGRWHDHG